MCWIRSANKQHCHVGADPTSPYDVLIKMCEPCMTQKPVVMIDSINYHLQRLQCKNRPWALFILFHIVRRNIACFCKAVKVTRHNLVHQLNHNKVLNKKYNIFFKNQYNILLGNFLSVSACCTTDIIICTKISHGQIHNCKYAFKTIHRYFSTATESFKGDQKSLMNLKMNLFEGYSLSSCCSLTLFFHEWT